MVLASFLFQAKLYVCAHININITTCDLISACNVRWLGVRGDDLQLIPEQSLVPLKPRDLQIAKSLMSSEILQVYYPTTRHLFCLFCVSIS